MQNILITGTTGYIGENVARHLLSLDYRIHALVRDSSNVDYLPEGVIIFASDASIDVLSEFMINNKIDVVIHIASKFIVEHSSSQVDDLLRSNIEFGTHILEAMKNAGVTKLINTASTWQHFDSESLDYIPTNLYAATKEAFNVIIDYYSEACGITAITLSIFDSYGPNDRRGKLVSLLNQFVEQQTELNMSEGEQEIGLTHISDIVAAYAQALVELSNTEGHKKFVIQPQKIFTLRQVVAIFEKITDSSLNINWGAKMYRQREVMKAWTKGINLPGWHAKISIEEGLRILNADILSQNITE